MHNFRIFKKTKFLMLAATVLVVAGVFLWVDKYKNENTESVNAATQKVHVVGAYDDSTGRIKIVNYSDAGSSYGWPGDTDRTSIFKVGNDTRSTYKGICAEPQAYDPVWTEEKEAKVYTGENRDLIRLLLYVYFSDLLAYANDGDGSLDTVLDLSAWKGEDGLTEVWWNLAYDIYGSYGTNGEGSVPYSLKILTGLQQSPTVFGSSANAAKKLVLTHETIGQLYHDNNDSNNIQRALNRLVNNNQTQLMQDIGVSSGGSFTGSGVIGALNTLNNNHDSEIWKEVQKYDVYYSDNIAQHQDIVWIAPKRGGLTIKKVDADNGTTTPQGNISSFNGTEFHVYRKDDYSSNGDAAYNVATLTIGSDGTASSAADAFLYDDYVVKESKSVTGYTLNETLLNVTIDAAANDYSSTPITDSILTDSLAIQKCDGATNLCTPQSGRSFAGITFEIYNNSINPIYYNNVSYAKGAKITSQTAGEDGQVIFSNLPYGSYIVKESNGNEFYAKSDASLNLIVPDNSSASNNFNNSPTSIGSITVKKCDEDLYNLNGSCDAQGDGDFSGIQFSLYKDDTLVAGPTTLTNGQVVFNNLADGNYVVKESGTSVSYNIDETSTKNATISGSNRSQTVTFTNTIKRDRLAIQKCDADLSECIPQEEANFAGITFSIYSKSSKTIVYGGRAVAPNGLVTTATTNEVGIAALGDLPYGTYMVKETGTNAYYNIDKNPDGSDIEKTIDFTNIEDGLVFYDTIKGNISIEKCDTEIGEGSDGMCHPRAGASFSGIEFTLYNDSGSNINWNGQNYANGAVMKTQVVDANGKAEFKYLPHGKYLVKETKTNASYLLNGTGQQVTLSDANPSSRLTFNDAIARGDAKLQKVDEKTGEPMANISFKIRSNNTGEEYGPFVTNEEGIMNTQRSGGKVLPYGSYTITELECDGNFYCSDRTASKTFKIESNSQIVDLGTWKNDCHDPEIKTVATNAEDNTKIIAPKSDAKIKDTVSYCLKAGEKFRIFGILMNKETGEPLLVDDKVVTTESVIEPEEDCGTTEIIFDLDAHELAKKDIVIFERAYLGEEELTGDEETDDLRLVAKHEDLEDDDQTIHVSEKISNTGLFTKTESGAVARNVCIGSGIIICAYFINVVRKRKKIRF